MKADAELLFLAFLAFGGLVAPFLILTFPFIIALIGGN